MAAEIVKIAKELNLSADDLIIEAETVETCGAWLHNSLVGCMPIELREAAEKL